ncbi:MAG: GntR family transcriptional regulator [Clostridia bacterium]|nr:GntR family transcriptional regulator [Clostridia bacterium]
MLFQLNLADRTPAYEQLEQLITKYVCLGVLEPHERLPSVRAMAGELGINPNTVAKTYKLLETKGILYTVAGKGAFIADNENAKAAFARKCLADFDAAVAKAKTAGIAEDALIEALHITYEGGRDHD